MERSFFMVKPDGVERGLVGEITSRVEKRGLKIIAMKMLRVDESLGRKHYAEHAAKPFFQDLVAYITSGPCVAMVVDGNNAIKILRDIIGKTNPKEAAEGTIRGDFGIDVSRNVVHASDSRESAKREIELFFKKFKH